MAALAAASAIAQQTPAGGHGDRTRDANPAQLDKVVVTARRRDEPLQNVPLSVSALSEAELQSRGAPNITALGAATPDLTLYQARGFNGTLTATIRGIGQYDPVWGVDPGVGIYVDDVYLARPQAALLDILDVQRIEVLRGPQGALYGKNTIGGAIKVVTRAPDETLSGHVALTAGSYDQHDAKAVLNFPVGEHLRTRIALGRFEHAGYGHNLVTGEDVSDRDAMVARITTDWLVSDELRVRLAYDRYRDRSGVPGARRLAINPLDPLGTPPDDGRFDVRSDLLPNADQMEAQGLSAIIDLQPAGRWQLKAISAFHESRSDGTIDFDTLPLPIAALTRHFRDRQLTQEVQGQWSGERDHAVAGLYLLDGRAEGAGYTQSGPRFDGTRGAVDTLSAALYADVTRELDPRWSIEGGLRYTLERKQADVLNLGYADPAFHTPDGSIDADFRHARTFGAWSPRLSASYRPGDAVMLYAQVSRGFKSGTYNIRADTVDFPASEHPLRDESVTSFELGAKTQWLDDRLVFDAAVFRNLYRDIQLSVFTGYDSDGNGSKDAFFGDFRNASGGVSQGAEFELTARSGRHLRWMAHAGYLDTHYDTVLIGAGQHFANAPRWTGGASCIAEFALRNGAAWVGRLDGNYQSRVYPTTDPGDAISQDGYTLWNASLTWNSPQQAWQLALFAQNLGDKAYRTSGFIIAPAGIVTGYYGPPRTVGLSLTRAF